MNKIFISIIVSIALHSCRSNERVASVSTDSLYSEPHRPKFHFTPKANWMNDPNGMVYHKGEYHLFYQHYPDGDVWGPMHWGHAVSNDMLRWQHLPIALYPDSLGMIFSGSAVVDVNNTSGLGTVEQPPLVAIFTYHYMEGEKAGRTDYQTQGIAYSNDKGRTWKKYENNPVVKNPGIKDFRDPKVFWHEKSSQWVMVLAVLDHVEFYGSPDLKRWNKLGEFGQEYGSHGGVWECPDLFELAVEGEQTKKWILLLSINPGGPNGGSGTQYFIGDFDGKTFSSEKQKNDTAWIDHGPDNYAGVTWSDVPKKDGRRIFLGWMSNWAYANVVPTSPWRSAMTIPRELKLKRVNGEIRLHSIPVKELNTIVTSVKTLSNISVTNREDISSRIDFPITTSSFSARMAAADFVFELSNAKAQKLRFGYDSKANRYFIDRGSSGDNRFSENFNALCYAPRLVTSSQIGFTVFLDVASIEIFFDDGITVMTAIFFPDAPFDALKIFSDSNFKIDSMEVRQLSSTWQKQ